MPGKVIKVLSKLWANPMVQQVCLVLIELLHLHLTRKKHTPEPTEPKEKTPLITEPKRRHLRKRKVKDLDKK